MLRTKIVAACVAVAAVAAVGLTAVLGGGSSKPASATPRQVKVLEAAAAPGAASTVLTDVGQQLTACMASHGFTYTSTPPPSLAAVTDGSYGISQPPPEPQPPTNTNDATYAALTPAQQQEWDAALHGPCADVAKVKTTAFMSALTEVGPSVAQAEAQFNKDPAVIAAYQQWASCMAGRGHLGLTTPDALRTSLLTTIPTHTDEVELATSDRSCQQTSSGSTRSLNTLPDVLAAKKAEYLAPVVAAHTAAVDTLGGL